MLLPARSRPAPWISCGLVLLCAVSSALAAPAPALATPAPAAPAPELSDSLLGDLALEGVDELLQEAPAAAAFLRQVERTPSNTFVLTREQIEAVNPKHPAEMLRLVPGFVVLRRQQFSYEISAFGTGDAISNKVLVLLDGHRVTAPDYGAPMWSLLPLVQDDLERIEVVLGPETAVHGSGAYAAVVNFVTRSPRVEEEGLVLRSGSDSFHQANFVTSSRNGRGATRLMLSSDHRGTLGPYVRLPSGQIDPAFPGVDRFTQGSFRLQHQRSLASDTQLRFSIGGVRSDASGVVPVARIQQGLSDSAQSSILLTLDLDRALSVTRHLRFRSNFQRIQAHYGTPPLAFVGVNESDQSSSQGEYELSYQWEPGPWNLRAGAKLRHFQVASPYNFPVDGQTNESLFFTGEREFGDRFVLFLGARSIFPESSPDMTSWKVAGLYRPRPDLGFRLSVGRSFREPDFAGMFLRTFPNATRLGVLLPLNRSLTLPNPGLENEEAHGFVQFGIERIFPREQWKLDFYRSDHDNAILVQRNGPLVTGFFAPLGVTIPVGRQIQQVNVSGRSVRGLTFSWGRDLPRDLRLQLGVNLQDLDDPNYAVQDPYAPPRSASLLLSRATPEGGWGGSLQLRAVDAYGISPTQRGAGYGLVDVNLERSLGSGQSLSVTVRNLLDREHVEVSDNWVRDLTVDMGLFFGREVFLTWRTPL